jgi:hypothetical protein
MAIATAYQTQKIHIQKVEKMPSPHRINQGSTRHSLLRSQLEALEIGEIVRIACNSREEASSIRSDIYRLFKELGWKKDPATRLSQRTALLEEGSIWALYVTRFG